MGICTIFQNNKFFLWNVCIQRVNVYVLFTSKTDAQYACIYVYTSDMESLGDGCVFGLLFLIESLGDCCVFGLLLFYREFRRLLCI